MIWLAALGGIRLLSANSRVLRAVITADGRGVAPVVRRRRGKPEDLRRAA